MKRDQMTATIQTVLAASHKSKEDHRAAVEAARQAAEVDRLRLKSVIYENHEEETENLEAFSKFVTRCEKELEVRYGIR